MARGGRLSRPEGPYNAVVNDLSHDGRGVVRIEGKAVFVPDVLPGEEISLFVTRRRRQFDEGSLERVLEPAPQRVEPRCPHFGLCGGCTMQHLTPRAQLAYKQRSFLETLSRIGGVTPARVCEPIGSQPRDTAWGYRRRARLSVKYLTKKGQALVGFHERGRPFIAAMEGCDVLQPDVGRSIQPLRSLLAGLSIRASVPQIEVAAGDNAIALVFRVLKAPSEADRLALSEFATNRSLWIYLQSGGPETTRALSPGAPPLHYDMPRFDLRIQFRPNDFVQVNAAMNRALVAQAVDWLAPGPEDRVLDLFSGLGNFSLPLARRAGKVVAVEGDPELVKRGRGNARRNGLDNVHFEVRNLFDAENGPGFLKDYFQSVLLDPPRTGAQAILPHLRAHRPRRVLYVSCHPGTLARDVGYLVREAGYRLDRVGAVDMFPHTAHVEVMALLSDPKTLDSLSEDD